MERPSCVGCLLTSGILIVFFTTVISLILSRIFKAGAFDEVGTVSMYSGLNIFMAHKTLVATSFIVAILPTLYFAALINDVYVKYKKKKEKMIEEATQAYHAHKDQKLYDQTLPKTHADMIDPSQFKAPSKSLPKNMQKKEEPKEKSDNGNRS